MAFRSEAQSLLQNEDFQALFESADSPVAAEIERLQRRCQDPAVSDHLRMLHIKWRLEGILAVFKLVQDAAKEKDEAQPPTQVVRLGQRIGKYRLRRGLIG